ncbi:MAG: hypothetical protein IIV72_08305 [Alistipes sp.]|nr:hypothetical protein [Alistipes sp.]
MRTIYYILIAFAVGLFIGLLLGKEHRVVTTHTTVDTVVYYRPIHTASATTEVRTISLPRLLFAPADTVHTTTVIVKGESVELQVPIERREYRDSSYYAVVSGAVVGDIHPTLESIETYAKNTVQTTYVHPPKVRPYVSGTFGKQSIGAGGGVILFDKHGIGADYIYTGGQGRVMARYTFIFR